ncbi:hypothetical protein HOK51_05370 [Candidatus Woesearchaeota archaeon]|jgi:HTH-type transcriptional regulator, sugar sensing transcriptional regulator|nr:hypothetical protein [Candidatus Woesearchaeota archaeon]MBT6519257.1 hypothetical protein [Candidatus Woesearchaeota archaeon]MBT7368449.1 hypothetical protein [Candidatus Woesearchaeota archaeon]
MINQELKELNLTDNEIKVYLTLLENGILNPTKLAEKTGLHRSYIYDTLERLIDRGIVNTVQVNNKKHYQPVNPKALREIFELKLKRIDEIMPQLSNLFNATKEETRIELHRGKRVYLTLIKDILSNVKKNETIYLIGIDESLVEKIEPIYLKQYLNTIKTKKIKEKIIIKPGSKKISHQNIEYKELDSKFLGETIVAIYQNKTFIFIPGNPLQLITIESNKFASSYKKQFNLMWNNAT